MLSDLNACYASIEITQRPELRGKPVAVCGSVEERHGIILAKSDLAKKYGIKTGMVRWQAMRLCPSLVTVPPNIELYRQVTNRVREIYSDYSNLRDDFSIDESWIDLTGTCGTGKEPKLAHEIKERLKSETGLTASMGLSWNRVFAKLGSDIAGPDSIVQITRDNMKKVVWPLPVQTLMGVGRATKYGLSEMGIETIGELAGANPDYLKRRFGKNGTVLYAFANGIDTTPIKPEGTGPPLKSLGNSTTAARDLKNDEDVRIVLMTLAESVAMRLREESCKAYVIEVSLRTTDLRWLIHQRKIKRPTDCTHNILDIAFGLYKQIRLLPLRGVGIRASTLVPADEPEQMNLFEDEKKHNNKRVIDRAVDNIREQYGYHSIQRGLTKLDDQLGTLNAREEHLNFARF